MDILTRLDELMFSNYVYDTATIRDARAEIERLRGELAEAREQASYKVAAEWRREIERLRAALPSQTGWGLDTSTGHPILVYQRCSVIQDEQAVAIYNAIMEADKAAAAAKEQP